MDLVSDPLYLVVPLVESFLPVRQVEQCVVLLLLACEQWCLAPGGHEFLDLFHIVLGLLDAGLEVNHLVTGLLDVVPVAYKIGYHQW